MEKKLHVLIIEDNPLDAELMVAEIQLTGYKIVHKIVETEEQLHIAIENQTWDIILSDYNLPGFRGDFALEIVRQTNHNIPFIFVSGTIGEERAVALMKGGANDFISKNNLARLLPAIERELRDAESRRQRDEAEKALRESEERYRTLVNSLHDHVFIFDKDDCYSQIYYSNTEILILPPEELIGKHITECLPQEPAVQYLESAGRVRNSGLNDNYDFSLEIKGDTRWFSASQSLHEDRESIVSVVREISERIITQSLLKDSEEKYRTLFQNAQVGLFRTRINDGKVIECNETGARILGYSCPDEVIAEFVAAEHYIDPTARLQILELLKKNGKFSSIEAQISRRDGTPIWIEYSATLYSNEGFIESVVVDISERKKAEEQVQREVERTKLLLELYLKAPEMSDRELFEYTLEKAVELTGSTIGFFHRVSPDQKEVILTAWNAEALLHCKASYDTHYNLEDAGNWVDCIRQKKPIVYNDFANSPNQKGQPKGHIPIKRYMSIPVMEEDVIHFIFGVGNKSEDYEEHDVVQLQLIANELTKIIKQRKSDEMIKENEKKYRTLAEKSLQGITIVLDGRSVYANQAYAEVTGHTIEEILALSPEEALLLIHPDDVDWLMQDYVDFLRGKITNPRTEFRVIHKDGSVKWVESYATSIDYMGKPALQIVQIDITKRKKAQQNMAEALDHAEFYVDLMSHDLSNINQAVLGSLDVAIFYKNSPELNRNMVKEAINQIQRATQLITNVRKLRLIEEDPPKLAPLDPAEALSLAFYSVQNDMPEKKLVLNANLNENEFSVDADEFLSDIFYNVLHNSMRYDARETVEVDIKSEAIENDNYLRISIIDRGKGIPDKLKKYIFERIAKKKEGLWGTGIGLTLTKRIIDHYGGQISVEDRVEGDYTKGTKITIILPIAESESISIIT